MSVPIRVLLGLTLLVAGCDAAAPAAPAPKSQAAASGKESVTRGQEPGARGQGTGDRGQSRPGTAVPTPQSAIPPSPPEDLIAQADVQQFGLPEIQDGKIAAAGIRKLNGKHITIYTDLAEGAAVEELPRVFDAAVPLWCEYFGVEPAKVADWKIVGSVMKDKERFVGAGLYRGSLPDFSNGFSEGAELWLYDQPSDYYRRHLLLHEGTHAFMNRWLGGAGPPWYMEGMAELLGTHQWDGRKLKLAHLPRTKDEVPYWGRIKIVKEEFAASRGMPLTEIMKYDNRAHLRNEPYGWCWAAAAFLDQHPQSQADFRELRANTADRSADFSNRFREKLKDHWREIDEDFQLFVIECDYGYDVARAAVVRKPVVDLPAGGATVTIAADRGWQSSGYKLRAGRTYQVNAKGRYQVGNAPKAWPCEPGGVTIRYVGGRPLGMLLGATSDEETPPGPITPLAFPQPLGASATMTPETTGTFYLRINELVAGLGDNAGTLSVRIEPAE